MQFIAHETSIHAEEIEILVKKPRIDTSPSVDTSMHAEGQINTLEDELQILEAQESLSGLPACFSSSPGNLVSLVVFQSIYSLNNYNCISILCSLLFSFQVLVYRAKN